MEGGFSIRVVVFIFGHLLELFEDIIYRCRFVQSVIVSLRLFFSCNVVRTIPASLLMITLHWLFSLSPRCWVGCCMNCWLEHILHWYAQVTLLSPYLGSLSAVVRREYDLVLILFKVCLRIFYHGFSKYPLLCFAYDYCALVWQWFATRRLHV